jgi:hypothetical protein
VVTRVPPVFMGYRHCGNEIYLDRYGRIRKLTGVWRSRDRWRGIIRGLWKWQLDFLSDHSIGQYAGHIATVVDKEENENGAGATNGAVKGSKEAHEFVARTAMEAEGCESSVAEAKAGT